MCDSSLLLQQLRVQMIETEMLRNLCLHRTADCVAVSLHVD